MDRKIVGKCSLCGGIVSVPAVWFGVNRPPKTCESCGAVAKEAVNLPVIPMTPKKKEDYGCSHWKKRWEEDQR